MDGSSEAEARIQALLRKAELHIVLFDRNQRREMAFRQRRMPFYIMSYHKEGTARLRIEGDGVYDIPPRTVMLVPPDVLHDHFKDTKEETDFMFWHFTFTIDGVFDVLRLFRLPLLFPLRRHAHFEETFARYLAELRSREKERGVLPEVSGSGDGEAARPPDKPAAPKERRQAFILGSVLEKAQSYELLYYLLQEALEVGETAPLAAQPPDFLDMLARILERPQDPLSLKALAAQYHMHPTYISNRFKALYGTSPLQLQREARMQQAKSLLAASELAVADVGRRVGFEELPAFSRLFRALVGMSPSDYRKRCRTQAPPH